MEAAGSYGARVSLPAIVPNSAVDLCAGPGGWDVHAEGLGLRVVGIEWDDDACATRRAAGLPTVQDDVARLHPEVFALVFGRPEGIIGSPPCTLFSSAGKGVGRDLMAELHAAMADAARGADDMVMARHRRKIKRLLVILLAEETMGYKARRRGRLVPKGKPSPPESRCITRAERSVEAERMSRNVALVWQPIRWAARLHPEWIALEQVPPVLPLWKEAARGLEARGYKCWVGILSSETFGVPQTRKRAFLLASRVAIPHPPEATHQAYKSGEPAREGEATLFGPGLQPWVSMAEALGWGAGRFGFPRRDDVGTSEDGYRDRDWRDTGEPAGVVTEKARSFIREVAPEDIAVEVNRSEGSGGRRPRMGDEPSPTIRAGAGGGCGTNLEITFLNGTHEHRAERDSAEPAPALHFGERLNTVTWDVRTGANGMKHGRAPEDVEPYSRTVDAPSPTVDTKLNRWELVANDQPKAARRGIDEPAPTIKGGHDTADRRFVPVEDRDPERTVLDRRQTGGDGVPVGPRSATAPASTMTAEGLRAGRDVWRDVDDPEASWTRERPSPTIVGGRRSDKGGLVGQGGPGRQLPAGEGRNVGGRNWTGATSEADGRERDDTARDPDWPDKRPSTALQGDPRVAQPGHKRDEANPDSPGRMEGAVRVSVAEAAVLQSFPVDWPWQGTRTSQFQQIGNAVPPLMARRVLEAASGRE